MVKLNTSHNNKKYQAGTSMVKYTKNAPVYYNYKFLGPTLKSSSKVLFKLDFFLLRALSCCVKYLDIEYQDEIFKNYH